MKVLFVCLGNICRSPTAEAVFKRRAAKAGLNNIQIDSAGTGAWHIGNPPDPRSRAAAETRGYSFEGISARKIAVSDFETFDYVLAMDRSNLKDLKALEPAGSPAKLSLFLDYAPPHSQREVPDPYYGGPQGFEQVIDLIEAASDGFIMHLRTS